MECSPGCCSKVINCLLQFITIDLILVLNNFHIAQWIVAFLKNIHIGSSERHIRDTNYMKEKLLSLMQGFQNFSLIF